MPSLIKLKDIKKSYQLDKKTISVLNGIDLEINAGEMLAIVGASGSGKSTLMNIMGFLDRATSGEYLFENQSVLHLSGKELSHIRNAKIGFVFQSFFLLPRLTALQNVMLPLFYREIPLDESKKRAHHLLKKMGVLEVAHHKPNQLSGGQQQRVAIARALIGEPKVILADEPTGALDYATGSEMMEIFKALNKKEGATIVIITHDREVSEQCQRIVHMKDGYLTDQF